ncbi:MAG: 50S ribosomal protein L22 [Candidatus Micrarchaeota archaeon]
MKMKGYSSEIPDNCARARVEGVNASYKDLSEVCGRIRNRKTDWAVSFLEKAAEGEVAVFFRRHNKKLGHRRELGGRKGRYPEKAAGMVLKVLRSAIANGKTQGLGEVYTILAASANKLQVFPRMASKGRTARSFLETSRIEIVLKGAEVPKGVSVTPPKKAEKPAEAKKEKAEAKKEEKKAEVPVVGKEEKKEPPKLLKEEGKPEHKHELEKIQDSEKNRAEPPHQHGEYNKR